MTVDRKEVITIPKWLVIWLIPFLVAGITTFGVIRANSARQDEKVQQLDTKVKIIDEIKVNRNEFHMMQDQLNRIEEKLDNHISR